MMCKQNNTDTLNKYIFKEVLIHTTIYMRLVNKLLNSPPKKEKKRKEKLDTSHMMYDLD